MKQLSDLTAFNQALVYTFVPETIHNAPAAQLNFFLYGQYNDMLDGYLYAQTILTELKEKKLSDLTPQQLIGWIKGLHQNFARALLANSNRVNARSGNYLDSLVIHWNHGSEMSVMLAHYFRTKESPIKRAAFLKVIEENYLLINPQDGIAFVDLLQTMINDESLPINPAYNVECVEQGPNRPYLLGLHRLATAYHADSLTPESKAIVEKIISIIRPPDQIESSMLQFAERVVNEWKTVDTKDPATFCLFLAGVYQELASLHPFTNANKRTARCLLNIMLCSAGYPSIHLQEREGCELKNEPRVLKAIAEDIDQGIKEANATSVKLSETENMQKKLFDIRVQIYQVLEQILALYPQYNVAKLFDSVVEKSDNSLTKDFVLLKKQMFYNLYILAEAKKNLASLQNAFPVSSSATSMWVNASTVKTRLREITNCEQWKVSADLKNIWIEVISPEEALSLVKILEESKCCKPLQKLRADTGRYVVTLESLDVKKLLAASACKPLGVTMSSPSFNTPDL